MVYVDGDADWEHTMVYEDGDWMLPSVEVSCK